MSTSITVLTVVAIIGCGIVGGIFFAFSNFVMQALARVPSVEGILGMQTINVTVLNPGFLTIFMGTAVVCVVLAVMSVMAWGSTFSPYLLIGALAYVLGTWLVTGIGNVPLNNELATVVPSDPQAIAIWTHYLERWTQLNTLRTIASILAMMLLTIGLVVSR